MDPQHIQRLKEEQQKAIEQTQGKINQLDTFLKDYEALKDRLETLPHKISHDIMVPFGKLAFMPGRLVHTNEITVLLGDNWFVERSAKQAAEISERRIQALKTQINDFEKQKGLLQPRKEFTDELHAIQEEKDGVMDIMEEYNEERERLWKIEHRKQMREYRKQEREARAKALSEKKEALMTDTDVFARLDELEKQERAGREMLKLDEELEEGSTQQIPPNTPDWCSQVKEGEPDTQTRRLGSETRAEPEDDIGSNSSDVTTDSDQENPSVRPATIRFSHSKTNNPHGVTFGEETASAGDEPTIKSPADVYKMFMPDKPKSILKSPSGQVSPSSRLDPLTDQQDFPVNLGSPAASKPLPTHVGPSAFTGSIIERQTSTPATPPSDNPPQRVSKFKAERMKRQPQSPQ